MDALTSAERRALRARAHALDPVVIVGPAGLTGAVLAEVERSLAAHELIKIRVSEAGREEREGLLAAVCAQTGAAPVQHIGKVLVVFRAKPPEAPSRASRPPAKAPAKKDKRTERPGYPRSKRKSRSPAPSR